MPPAVPLSTPGPTVAPRPTPTADAEPRTVARQLDAVNVRGTGSAMEVWYALRRCQHSRWILLHRRGGLPAALRPLRSFTRSNLRELRVQHDVAALHLALVLRAGAPAPQLEAEPEGLRILVQ